jgi:hypothetical protein
MVFNWFRLLSDVVVGLGGTIHAAMGATFGFAASEILILGMLFSTLLPAFHISQRPKSRTVVREAQF